MVGMTRIPISKANRHQRRAAMKGTGRSWASARALAKRQEADRKAEAEIAAKASRLSPYEARKALAEWAARGGSPTKVNDPTNFNPREG